MQMVRQGGGSVHPDGQLCHRVAHVPLAGLAGAPVTLHFERSHVPALLTREKVQQYHHYDQPRPCEEAGVQVMAYKSSPHEIAHHRRRYCPTSLSLSSLCSYPI